MAILRQKSLFCLRCGSLPTIAGFCTPCYARRCHSALNFAGVRDQVLLRDSYQCQGCGAGNQRPVHHRRPGVHDKKWLITLCPACHAIVHKLRANKRWLPVPLLELWCEQHPHVPLQLQFAIYPKFAGNYWGGEAALL